jgi:hypothetical protein
MEVRKHSRSRRVYNPLRSRRCIVQQKFTDRQPSESSSKLGADGRAIAQAVSRWLPTAAAHVRVWVRSCGICRGQSGAGVAFLRVHRFPLPIFIPPDAPQPTSIICGWYNRPVIATVWSGLSLTPRIIIIIIKAGGRSHTHRPGIWKQYCPPSTRQYGVTSQMIVLIIITALRTSDLTLKSNWLFKAEVL